MKNCDNCGNCVPHNPFIPICEQCVYVETAEGKTPSNWKPLPMTNADRIRAMTDEELAEYLVYHNPYSTEQNCLKWLQQPAEGGCVMLKIIEVNPGIRANVEANNGYCPCAIWQTPDTKCMYKDFREQTEPGECYCGRFEKVRAEDGN